LVAVKREEGSSFFHVIIYERLMVFFSVGLKVNGIDFDLEVNFLQILIF
jgi:hypothetical protein